MINCLSLVNDDYFYMCDYNQVINASTKDMFLEHGHNRRLSVQDVKIDEEILKNRIKYLPQMILEVSENCNLRCKYCVYNGEYMHQRSLSPKQLSFETARKGIEYVYSFINGRKKKEFNLSFYGGEPLLNFDTIKEIVQYGKKRFVDWKLDFNITTNLTLLDESILSFMVENNFFMLVSLDGDSDNHDAKRVLPNGKGTHAEVMKNLEYIKKKYNDYFQEHITFSAVYSFDLPLQNMHRFFSTNEIIKNQIIRFSTVNTSNTTYYDHYPLDKDAYRSDIKKIFSGALIKIREKEKLSGYEVFLYQNLLSIKDKMKVRSYTTLSSSCLFDNRLYLDANGCFHICEKINNRFSFGDVDRGFDWPRMTAIAKEFQNAIKTYCSNCNIRFLCNACFVTFNGDSEFKPDPEYCEGQKKAIVANLEKYIECKQERLI
ncbi:MAG TPA: radical SAM protein [Candidatus Kapabacteria bacterium]|nr:radical SAM protein [Candidatus Kapabacteria bacterium]